MEQNITKSRIEILLLFVLYLFILPRVYMDYDMGFWRDWALYIHHHGLAHAYDSSSINYFPIFLYGLYLFDLLQVTDANIIANINNIKILFVCFDFLPIIVLCCFRQKLLKYQIPYLYLLLNVAYVFNSMVWGQIDSMYTNLAFLAIIVGVFYPVAGTVLFALALNTKAQAIEFLPVVGLLLLFAIRKWQTAIVAFFSFIGVQILVLIPFFSSGGVSKIFHHVTHSVDLYNNLSISAFNLWYLITNDNPYEINDKSIYFLFSYKTIGIALFAIAGTLIIVPFTKYLQSFRKQNQPPDALFYQHIFLATGMICLCFFYFNSQMHERYAHPIILFFFFYGVVSKNYKLYILASVPYILSLDKCFSYPDGYLPVIHFKIIYASKIIAIWYTATLLYGAFLYYKLVRR